MNNEPTLGSILLKEFSLGWWGCVARRWLIIAVVYLFMLERGGPSPHADIFSLIESCSPPLFLRVLARSRGSRGR